MKFTKKEVRYFVNNQPRVMINKIDENGTVIENMTKG